VPQCVHRWARAVAAQDKIQTRSPSEADSPVVRFFWLNTGPVLNNVSLLGVFVGSPSTV
jgi:hypothetical protein